MIKFDLRIKQKKTIFYHEKITNLRETKLLKNKTEDNDCLIIY